MVGLTDAQIAALEAEHQPKGGLTDEQMTAMEAEHQAKLDHYDPMQALSDTLRAGAQGATLGHLPQLQGALESGHISGDEYEAAKMAARQKLDEARKRNAPLAFAGEMAGSMAVPAAAGFVLPKVAGVARTAAVGALQGAGQNPGGDVDTEENLKGRGKQAVFGGLLGALAGKFQAGAGSAAERQAFNAMGPLKKDVLIARNSKNLNEVGREILDQNIIGNVPRSKDTLYERADAAHNMVGARKSDIISALDKNGGDASHIDMAALRDNLVSATAQNPNLPSAAAFNQKLKDYAERLGMRSPLGAGKIGLAEADKLKTQIGKQINYLKTPTVHADPELQQLNEAAYNHLNHAVDETAQSLAQRPEIGNPQISDNLTDAKKSYGNLSDAKRILNSRIASEGVKAPVEQGDMVTGALGTVGTMMAGSTPGSAIGTGVALGVAAKLIKKYGAQVAAKQLDNMSKALNYGPAFNLVNSAGPAAGGAYDRSSAWSQQRKKDEEK